ncbi:complex I subunit 5 family protein [Rhabdochromatium marinum]|uniref:complex I subunit 5 family protein n=1 Tax=Rhabdochromatium marinum TaxID=48729 RepID=UPI001907B689|nr:proton-conducting transporter membrane subunit [Rhabdochromatium marinum]MBK1647328.1 hypothetical protein [Rhabdochromatium marinum]
MLSDLSSAWLLLAWVWPLLLAVLAPQPRLWWLPPPGALPALLTAVLAPTGLQLDLPWLILGTTLGLDATARLYLLFTALLWLVAGVFAASMHRPAPSGAKTDCWQTGRFNALFLLAMAGHFWLILGLDLISFYVGFAMMGLASYALVVHEGTPEALQAGRVYLIMALLGEVVLFAGLTMIAVQTGSMQPSAHQLTQLDDLTIALVLLGLAVKAGIFPLHLWLPLAHPAAPVAASAVLSGAMIKVALLGWLRFLPVGAVAWPHWGSALVLMGVLTLLFALIVGLTQRDLKVILAYSSISKMGFLLLLLGVLLLEPELAPVGVPALVLYVAHHGLVKGGLFLGVGLRKQAGQGWQPLILAGLACLALAMVAAPLTSGAVAKYVTKPLLTELPATWNWLGPVLILANVATVLLMARLLWLSWQLKSPVTPATASANSHQRGPVIAWSLLTGVILLLPLVLYRPSAWLGDAPGMMAGVALAAAVIWLTRLGLNPLLAAVGRIPPGDLLAAFSLATHRLRLLHMRRADNPANVWRQLQTRLSAQRATPPSHHTKTARTPATAIHEPLTWPVVGALWLSLGAALLLFLLAGQLD